MTNFEKELAILTISTAFMNMYMNSILDKYSDEKHGSDTDTKSSVNLEHYSPILKLIKKHSKMIGLYSRKIEDILEESEKIAVEIEAKSKELQPYKKFEKKLRVNQENELEVNGLVFAIHLILEHRHLNNRTLVLKYKDAEAIFNNLEGQSSKIIDNAKVLAKKYVERIKEL